MKYLLSSFRSPVFWIITIAVAFSIQKTYSSENLQLLVHSDGRGYYAYLPATILFGDKSYRKVLEAEKKYHSESYDQQYLYRNPEGKIYNKYFPGSAVLQLPFFLIACFLALLFHLPADGYSDVFMIFYFIGNIFFGITAILLSLRLYRKRFPDSVKRIKLLFFLLLLSGPVLFYAVLNPFYSHHISFFLFAAAANCFFDYSKTFSKRKLIWLGLTFGFIFLVRPTNLVFILFLPVLLSGKAELKTLWGNLFSTHFPAFIKAVVAFLIPVSILFILWKWQTGHWLVWSYSGEGFDFFHPQFWSVLFSFRIGLFIHIPFTVVLLFLVIKLWKNNNYQMLWWSSYFVTVMWIIAAWWCWDFESPFSIRPLTEHFLFLAFPVFLIGKQRLFVLALAATSILGIIRIFEFETGYMSNQRFTSSSYFKSLAFWKTSNYQRWNFNRSCHPFGKVVFHQLAADLPAETLINSKTEYALTTDVLLTPENDKGLMYYTVNLEKRFYGERMEDVYLVVDAGSEKGTKRYYASVNLYDDALEGKKDWVPLQIEGTIPDYFKDYEKVRIYIWNKGKQKLAVRNYRAVIDTYGK